MINCLTPGVEGHGRKDFWRQSWTLAESSRRKAKGEKYCMFLDGVQHDQRSKPKNNCHDGCLLAENRHQSRLVVGPSRLQCWNVSKRFCWTTTKVVCQGYHGWFLDTSVGGLLTWFPLSQVIQDTVEEAGKAPFIWHSLLQTTRHHTSYKKDINTS